MTAGNSAFEQEIRRLIARGVLVVTRDQAIALADQLEVMQGEDYVRQKKNWHLLRVRAISTHMSIVIDSFEELDRLHEEILDFIDRVTAGLVDRYSIHVININSEALSAFGWAHPTLALIGSWEPEMIKAKAPTVEDSRTLPDPLHDDSASRPREAESQSPILRFVESLDEQDIQEVAMAMEKDSGHLYEQIMMKLIKPVTRWLPNESAVTRVEELKSQMPHLGDFLDEVLVAMNLAIRFNADRFTLPPIILNGPPGVGKTYGLFALSEALGLSMESIPMSTTGAGFVLAGME